jgi:hypothetical protein
LFTGFVSEMNLDIAHTTIGFGGTAARPATAIINFILESVEGVFETSVRIGGQCP